MNEIQKIVDQFNNRFPELIKENEEIAKKATKIFKAKLDELMPIVDVMKSKRIYFRHPNLTEDIKTKHGIVIGINQKGTHVIAYWGGNTVAFIDISTDEVATNVTLEKFFAECDYDFVIKGMDYTKQILPNVIKEFEIANTKKNEILYKLRISDDSDE